MSTHLKNSAQLDSAKASPLAQLVAYSPGAIVSRAIKQSQPGSVTAFAFDEGQQLSEHTAPFDAFVVVADGQAELVIGGASVIAKSGEIVLMPANVPHAVYARSAFKMLLIMIRG
jgi:quercetin dioxygenase-like cupin family protein